MPQRAFTLVELLAVIGIIVILMGLALGGVSLARRSAQRARTVGAIAAVAAAIDQYRNLNNCWPEHFTVSDAVANHPQAPEELRARRYDQVYQRVFAPGGQLRPASEIPPEDWRAVNAALAWQLADLAREHQRRGLFLDAWEEPLRYRPARWYPWQSGARARIDSDQPPQPDSYQLWSAGPDRRDAEDPGEGGDDIPNWNRR
ncbi:MAG: type II secretion system protein [Planctomycetota bacterium]|nr:type II secretion system GspH family protein [Planctomycetota bacterium]MDW8372364.1 type II secretion system protein [Planctomycetota bacterium]